MLGFVFFLREQKYAVPTPAHAAHPAEERPLRPVPRSAVRGHRQERLKSKATTQKVDQFHKKPHKSPIRISENDSEFDLNEYFKGSFFLSST